MFLAVRDLRFATGRFSLMGVVVALISVLLLMLSGLTAGLAHQNTAALDDFGAQGVDRVVFGGTAGQNPEASFTASEFTTAEQQAWKDTAGVTSIEPVGISQGQLIGLPGPVPTDAQGRATQDPVDSTGTAPAAFIGLEPGSTHAPDGLAEGEAVLSESLAAKLGVGEGGTVEAAGFPVTVAHVVPDAFHAHSPVAWLSLPDWKNIAHVAGQDVVGTVGLASLDSSSGTDQAAVSAAADASAHTLATSIPDSYSALPAYNSEQGSLRMIQGFLYGISALVVIAFLSIWTVQRTRQIATLKALGASTGWVLRDSLVQAGIVLLAGVGIGTGLAVAAGAAASQAVPFVLSPATVALPALGVFALGMLGAALAVARVTRVDPLVALGGN